MAGAAPPPPPPAPPPPPPAPPGTPGTPGTPPGLGPVLREALQRAGEALGEDGGLRELLRRRRDSFGGPQRWLLFHRPTVPLLQDGPQCGLAALGMAAPLLGAPGPKLGLGALLEAARARGYTRHGEMFSAEQMAALAQELFPCRAELLQGGLGGPNRARVLRHLLGGRPLLVPYDEDSNHAPCCRRGHKAHWALLNGVVVAVPPQEPLGPQFQRDPEIPNLFHAPGGALPGRGAGLTGEGAGLTGEEAWLTGEEAWLAEDGESLFEEGASLSGGPGGAQGGSGGAQGAGGGSRCGEGSQPQGEESELGRGSRGEVPELGRGSHSGIPDLGPGSRSEPELGLGSGPELGLGSGSNPELGLGSHSNPELGLGSCSDPKLGLGSQEGIHELGLGSGSDPELGLGSGVGSGVPGGAGIGSGVGPRIGSGVPGGAGVGPGAGSGIGSGVPGGAGIGSGAGPRIGSGAEPPIGSGVGPRIGSGVLVLALQGKSPRPQLWPLPALGASNAQLNELSPRRWGGGFVLPAGGLRGGLRGRAVLLHPRETPTQ